MNTKDLQYCVGNLAVALTDFSKLMLEQQEPDTAQFKEFARCYYMFITLADTLSKVHSGMDFASAQKAAVYPFESFLKDVTEAHIKHVNFVSNF